MKKNLNSLDVMKFIACLFVAAIHIHPLKSFSENCDFLNIVIARFGVPFFFMATGFFFFSKIRRCGSFAEEKRTAGAYIRRLLQMYLFWYIVALPTTIYEFLQDAPITLGYVLRYLGKAVITSTYRGSWFLTASLIGIILVWLLSRRLSSRVLLVLGLVFYAFAIAASSYYGFFKDTALMSAYQSYKSVIGIPYNRWYAGVIYIVLGKVFADRYPEKLMSRWHAFLGLIASLGLLVVEMTKLQQMGMIHANDCCISLIPLSICLFALLLQIDLPEGTHYKKMRTISTVTFYLHFQLLAWITIAGDRLGFSMDTRVKYVLIVGICFLVTDLILLLEKKKHFTWLKYAH